MEECVSLQEMIRHIDEEKKGNSPIDQLWHEREILGALLCSLDVADSEVFAVIKDRIALLKEQKSAALKPHKVIVEGATYSVSLPDILLCNWACIKSSFDEAIANNQMDADESKNVTALADRIDVVNEMLQEIGVEQSVSDEDMEEYYQDIIEAVAKKTTEYAVESEGNQ